MSPAIRQVAPGQLEVREGGGCMAVFGLPFLGAGIAVTLASVGLLPVQNADEVPWFGKLLIMLMGPVFTLVGGALVFGRSWVTLNSGDRTVVTQVGLLMPMSTTTYRLDDYTTVLLGFQRGDSDSADQYPISLKARAGKNLRLFSSTQYAEARERAAAVASLFNLEIEDASTDHPVRLTAGQAHLSLQHRARLEHRRDEVVVRPSLMQSEVSESLGGVQIIIPARRVHPAVFIVFFVPMAVVIVLFEPFSRFFRDSHTPDPVAWIFLGFMTLAFGILPASTAVKAFLKSRLGRTTITASTTGIRIEERRAWKTRTVAALAADDIMDVDYSTSDSMYASARETADEMRRSPSAMAAPVGPGTEYVLKVVRKLVKGNGITIKTRQGLTTFGEGLDDPETRYLHYVVRRALVHGTAP